MTTILATVVVLGVLIFIHELGHFISAKLFGIRVDRFSLGYPPRLFGKKVGDTDYCISAIPFGGYVKIAGMVDESLDKKSMESPAQPWEYRSRPWIQRFLVIFAGPVMNILFAYLVFSTFVMVYGIGEPDPNPVIGEVIEGQPAEAIGLQAGDRIVSIDGNSVETWDAMTAIVRNSPNKTITLQWIRQDSVFFSPVTPVSEQDILGEGSLEVGKIGAWPNVIQKRVGPGKALVSGAENLYGWSRLILVSIYKLITRQASLKSIGGPVIIAKMAGESARSGIGTLIGFMALISLNLGILNLLPIPVLDGGHLLILSIEGVVRKQLPVKLKLIVQQVFMFLLLGLMVFIIYQDILKVVKK